MPVEVNTKEWLVKMTSRQTLYPKAIPAKCARGGARLLEQYRVGPPAVCFTVYEPRLGVAFNCMRSPHGTCVLHICET